MLRQSSSKKGSHIVWDEDNLKTNLEIQKQYSGVKIAEPKTPYRPPLLDAELDEEMRPLELDEEAAEQAKTAVMTAFDYVMRNGGADFSPPGLSHRRLQAASSADTGAGAADAADAGDDAADGAVGDKRTEPCTSFTSSGSEGCAGQGSTDKKRRFEAMRKQHYNMKQALQQAKHLLASEEEEVQEDEDEEADTAGWKAANGNTAGNSSADEQQHETDAGNGEQRQQQGATAEEQQQQQGRQQQQDGADVQDMDSCPEAAEQ